MMPLGISHLCVLSDYLQLQSRLALLASRLLYSYNTTASRKFSFILVPHYEQNAATNAQQGSLFA